MGISNVPRICVLRYLAMQVSYFDKRTFTSIYIFAFKSIPLRTHYITEEHDKPYSQYGNIIDSYNSYLEYCIQAWRPYRKKDIDILERVQRRATKMIHKLRTISYKMRLIECGLTTLETRRLGGDQIEVFKILNVYENIDRNIFSRLRKRGGLEDMELH